MSNGWDDLVDIVNVGFQRPESRKVIVGSFVVGSFVGVRTLTRTLNRGDLCESFLLIQLLLHYSVLFCLLLLH
jgi:hypothetical protein